MILYLKLKLLSDAAFGRGDGLVGVVDSEVQHDTYGCPYFHGRTLRGVLEEECANILYALQIQGEEDWQPAALALFGRPGSTDQDKALLRIGDACLPKNLREAIEASVKREEVTPQQVLASLTTIRRQTAMDVKTEAPKKKFLRATRLILRETWFESELVLEEKAHPKSLPLLAACVKALRRAGSDRNRGRGELMAWLCDAAGKDITQVYFNQFTTLLEENHASH